MDKVEQKNERDYLGRFIKGGKPPHFGKKSKNMSLSKIGSKNPMFGKDFTQTHRKKLSESLKKVKHYWAARGEKSSSWKGGITPQNKIIRASAEYKLWRKSVFERDGYKCIFCGAKNGNGKTIILHADHIKPFAYFPELRFAIDNGRTLCKDCHRLTETYGIKCNKIYGKLL